MATTGELATYAELSRAFYRLTGVVVADDSLVEQGEAQTDICSLALTRGFRACQRWLLANGLKERWRKRHTAWTTWSGTEAADGGRYNSLPTDLLRIDGNQTDRSALVQADGTEWGQEVSPDQDGLRGSFYYLKNDQLWLARGAAPPSPVYLRYYNAHAAITSATSSFDMPMDARWLCVAEAAESAVGDEWVPGGDEVRARVAGALERGRDEARSIIPRTREPRRMKGARVYASRW